MTRSMRLPGRRLAGVAAIAVAALTVSACNQVNAGAAAVVGNRRISVADLQTATTQILPLTNPSANIGQTEILDWMIMAPFAIKLAAANNVGVSTADARELFDRAAASGQYSGTPSSVAVETVRGVLALDSLQGKGRPLSTAAIQSASNTLVQQLKSAHIEINPRYGTFDASKLTADLVAVNERLPVTLTQPDWQVATPSTQPTSGQ